MIELKAKARAAGWQVLIAHIIVNAIAICVLSFALNLLLLATGWAKPRHASTILLIGLLFGLIMGPARVLLDRHFAKQAGPESGPMP